MRFTSKGLLVLSMSLALSTTASMEIPGEIIAAHDSTTGWYALMSAADGSNFTKVLCRGDLTHLGIPRYFVTTQATGTLLPDGNADNELVVTDGNCTDTRIISDTPSLRFSDVPAWSPDGTRIAVYGINFDLDTGLISEEGIYLADLRRDDPVDLSRPTGIQNLHLLVTTSAQPISWSGDSMRLAYVLAAPDGAGGLQGDIAVYDLASGISTNVTNTPSLREDHPSYSPVEGRIAFTRLVAVRGGYRYDIFTTAEWGGSEVQVTSKATTGNPQNRFPSFSPDGQYLSFSSGDPWKRFDIYKMKSNGSGKAVNLTYRRTGSFYRNVWRR